MFILTQGHTGDNERKKLWDELSRGIEHSRLVVVHLTKGNEGELGLSVWPLSFNLLGVNVPNRKVKLQPTKLSRSYRLANNPNMIK